MAVNGVPEPALRRYGQAIKADRKEQGINQADYFEVTLAMMARDFPETYTTWKAPWDGAGFIGRIERGTVKHLSRELAISMCRALKCSTAREVEILGYLGWHPDLETNHDKDLRVFLDLHTADMLRIFTILGERPLGNLKIANMSPQEKRVVYRLIVKTYLDFLDGQDNRY